MQKCRCDYISLGDKNTTYFHARTMERRRRNKIITLVDSTDNWITKEDQFRSMAGDFFKFLYSKDRPLPPRYSVKSRFPRLNVTMLDKLSRPILLRVNFLD